MSDIAIKVENLKKQYRLGSIGGGTLSADLESWWARKRGKEDPNTLIGTDQTKVGTSFYALNGISFEVKKGEAVGIIGSNGAGKSTLLKLLSRVTAPTEGKIGINGRITSMLEVGTGFHPELTGRENIYMNGAILGMTREEIDAKLEDIIDFSECRQFIDTPVKRYSSGMYVKLAFAVAAHLDSEILIMDEVLAVGDMKFQKKCLGKMEDSSENEGKTILYVSHNMATIRQLCSRCIVLDKGRIIYDGDVETAIAIYMESESGDLAVKYDLKDVERPSLEHGSLLRIESFEFMGVNEPSFINSDKIYFKLKWFSRINEKKLKMYMPLRYADSTPVGLAQSVEFSNNGMDTENECIFEFDISNIADGKYYFYLDFFVSNEFGAHRSYDHPNQNIYFSISRNAKSGIEWQRKYWGSVKLNQLQVVERY